MEQQRLIQVLELLGFDSAEVKIESASGGRLGGVLVSEQFAGQSQEQRQERLWKGLREKLLANELAQIVAIMTMTPEEIAA